MAHVTLSVALREFEDVLRSRHYAKGTIEQYQVTGRALVRAAGRDDLQLRHLSSDVIARLFAEHRDWSERTANRNLLRVRGFLQWARAEEYVPSTFDPTRGWSTTKEYPTRQRTWLTVRQMLQVREAAAAVCSRDAAFFDSHMFTLARGGELALLKVGDVNLDRGVIRVWRPKTKTRDELPICLELHESLVAWLSDYRDAVGGDLDPDWYLYPARGPRPAPRVDGTRLPHPLRPNRKMSHPGHIIRRALVASGYDNEGDGGHVLRRSSARCLYESLRNSGAENALRIVQAALGHQSIRQTEHYVGVDVLREARDDLLKGRRMFDIAA